MEFAALNQGSKTRQCEKDCVHLSLSWRRGRDAEPRGHGGDGARRARCTLGMKNAKALFVAHNDKPYACLHIVGSKLDPDTGRTYDLKQSWRKLGDWAHQYADAKVLDL